MPDFLVEAYRARTDTAAAEHVKRAREAAEDLNLGGTPVRYLHSIFVPDDETCLYLYEADSAETVRRVAQRAELLFARIVEAVADPA
jgi:Protein of unknown function (DUF4242)